MFRGTTDRPPEMLLSNRSFELPTCFRDVAVNARPSGWFNWARPRGTLLEITYQPTKQLIYELPAGLPRGQVTTRPSPVPFPKIPIRERISNLPKRKLGCDLVVCFGEFRLHRSNTRPACRHGNHRGFEPIKSLQKFLVCHRSSSQSNSTAYQFYRRALPPPRDQQLFGPARL